MQGIFRPAEHDAAVVGVVQADEEVGVVADLEGQMALDVLEGVQHLGVQGRLVFEDIGEFGVFGENALEVPSHDGMDWAAQGGEGIQRGLGEDSLVRLDGGQGREAIVRCKGLEIEGMVTDGDCDTRGVGGGGGDDAKGQIGKREVRAAGDGEPRAKGRHDGDEDGRRQKGSVAGSAGHALRLQPRVAAMTAAAVCWRADLGREHSSTRNARLVTGCEWQAGDIAGWA